jgi:predicted metal-dependent hydrolase
MLRKLRRLITPPPAPEARCVTLAGQNLPYTLKRSARRRTVGLRINQSGLTVSAPLHASEKWLHEVLLDKADWIVGRLRDWQERQPPEQRWADGEAVPFRGESFTLRVVAGARVSVAIEGETLRVKVADPSDSAAIERAVAAWYKRQARQLFDECIAYHAEQMGVAPKEVRLTSARTRWGSCTGRGVVRLNWRLVKLSLELVDYVVVHELAHLREMNHSAAFWRVVEAACPDYAQRRRALKRYPLAE